MADNSVPNTNESLIKEAGIVMTLVALVYFFSVSRQPLFGDGLELLCAAAVGGIPHPTGYPLFMLLLGPFSGSYFSGSLLCAFFGVIATGCASIMIGRLLTPSLESFPKTHRSVIRISLGLAVGLSHGLWTASTVIEVYALNTAIMSAALLVLISRPESTLCWRQLTVAGSLISLGLGNHLLCLSLLPLFGMRLLESFESKRTSITTLPIILIGATLPVLALYSTLPLRAALMPPINWGNPTSIDGIIWHLRGGDYGAFAFLQSSPGTAFAFDTYLRFFGARLLDLITALGAQFGGGTALSDSFLALPLSSAIGLLLFFVCGLGMKKLFYKNRYLFIGQSVGMLFLLFVIFTYNIPDIRDYFLGFFTLLFSIMIMGFTRTLGWLFIKIGDRESDGQDCVAAFVCAVVLLAFFSNSFDAMRRNDLSSRPVTRKLVESLPSNAVLITHSDYDSDGFLYERFIEGLGQGVYHVPMHFMIYDWYAAMRPEVGTDPFGRHVDPVPGKFDQRTAEDHFSMIVDHIVEPHIDSVPVYTTDVDSLMIQLLSREYELVLRVNLIPKNKTYDAYMLQHSSYIPRRVFQIKRKN